MFDPAAGPELATVMVYVTVPPGVVVAGPLFVTEMSACWFEAIVTVEELFPLLGSGSDAETVAVS